MGNKGGGFLVDVEGNSIWAFFLSAREAYRLDSLIGSARSRMTGADAFAEVSGLNGLDGLRRCLMIRNFLVTDAKNSVFLNPPLGISYSTYCRSLVIGACSRSPRLACARHQLLNFEKRTRAIYIR